MSAAHSARGAGGGGLPAHSPANRQRRLTVFVPVDGVPSGARGLPSWRALPFNPFTHATADAAAPTSARHARPTPPDRRGGAGAGGGGGGAPEGVAMPADAPFYCDPCQKGFKSKEAYDAHMAKHMYCTVPGCRFTCKADKAWKMEAHMDLLHNRPDAPALADPEQYLAQRRRRFPTHEAVQQKVEELYYKAARGVLMPDERRRWMRQHGIYIGKNLRTDRTFIARGVLPAEVAPPSRASSSSVSTASHSTSTSTPSALSDGPADGGDKPKNAPPADAPNVDSRTLLPVPKSAAARVLQHQQGGSEEARRVPRFYVCSRCGEKGQHWVRACPTIGDAHFDRHMVWGEPKREVGVAAAAAAAAPSSPPLHPSRARSPQSDGGASDAPPPVKSARRQDTGEEDRQGTAQQHPRPELPPAAGQGVGRLREVTRMVAPVAAARLAAADGASRGRGRGRGLGRGRAAQVDGPPAASLYEKLTEEDRLNEDGLLLQAIRFFVARDFFQ